ncbi:MAG: 3-deoxy-D-manno-octulosonic acid transferase [Nitrospinae bacterium]|nr:3-deoxy-D-manno-octulosonic acid transferase [Nitrospinota bacterium]
MLFLYNVVILLISPVLLVYFLVRLWIRGFDLRAVRERFGFLPGLPDAEGGRLWLHAVSVGEVGVAAVLVPALLKKKPGLRIVLSTVTPTGRNEAGKISGLEQLIYLPLDFPLIIRSALKRIRPSMITLIETEIWPNLVAEAARQDIPVSIVNGRLSERSYHKYKRFQFFFSSLLKRFTDVLARGERDAERFLDLGATSVRVSGNVKYDTPAPPKESPHLAYGLGACRHVIVAGSTHPGEEKLIGEVLVSVDRKMPGVGLLLAPRHLERVAQVEADLQDAGISPVRWSQVKDKDGEHQAVILDVMGELADAYGCAAMAIIGGSFIPHGGQNPIEAARWAVPCLCGPHMENFAEVTCEMVKQGGAIQLSGRENLETAVMKWLNDPELRNLAGEAARRVVQNNRGASERTAEYIVQVLAGSDKGAA